MPRLNAITFDLWDTLITEVPRKNPSLRQLRIDQLHSELGHLGHKFERRQIERAYALSGEFCDQIWGRNRDMPVDDHLLFLLTCLDSRLPSKLQGEGLGRIRKIYSETILQMPPILHDDVRSTIEELSKKSYKIGLISNTGRTPGDILRKLLDQMKISQYFDFMTFSNELMIRKPEKGIFIHTLKGLKTIPRLSVHVGDDRDADYMGARRAGMKAILIDRGGNGAKSPDVVHSLNDLIRSL